MGGLAAVWAAGAGDLRVAVIEVDVATPGQGFVVGGVLDVALPAACPIASGADVPETRLDVEVDLIIGFGV